MEKKGAVHTVIMSKTKEEAANLTEIFRKMTVTIHAKENSVGLPNNNSNDNRNCVLPSQNPLMNNIIIKHLFGFLPLGDMKRFRLVCRAWNSTAEICLRKRSSVHFRPSVLHPKTFMDIAKYSQPDLPFSSFSFSNYKNQGWNISDIKDFLEKWDKNIKEVSLNCIKLVRKSCATDKEVLIRNYNISPLFLNPSNITSLKINPPREGCNTKKSMDISLEKFVSIKTLSLNYCRIIVPPYDQIILVAPHSVELNCVSFILKGKPVSQFYYNDILDFNKITNVHLVQDYESDMILDMGTPVFNVKRMFLMSVNVINWSQAEGNVEVIRLCNTAFEEKINLKIKLMSFTGHLIDLNALPQTLEILHFVGNAEFECNEPLDMPNLKHVGIDVRDSASLAYFSNCPNLVELEICKHKPMDITEPYKFNVGWIPKSVKTIKMQLLHITFNDDCILELDALMFEYCNLIAGVRHCTAITSQIKPKVIILDFGGDWDLDTLGLDKLVAANKQLQKLIISNYGLRKMISFDGSDLPQYVNKKFSNENANEEFDKYAINDYFLPYSDG